MYVIYMYKLFLQLINSQFKFDAMFVRCLREWKIWHLQVLPIYTRVPRVFSSFVNGKVWNSWEIANLQTLRIIVPYNRVCQSLARTIMNTCQGSQESIAGRTRSDNENDLFKIPKAVFRWCVGRDIHLYIYTMLVYNVFPKRHAAMHEWSASIPREKYGLNCWCRVIPDDAPLSKNDNNDARYNG